MIASLFLIHTINCPLLKINFSRYSFHIYVTSKSSNKVATNTCTFGGVENVIVLSASAQLNLSSKAAK